MVGVNHFRAHKKSDTIAIGQIAVHPMFRKHGVARELIRRMIAANPTKRTVILKVERDNTEAVGFYFRLGFVVTSTEPARTGRPMLSMSITLTEGATL